MQKENQRRSEEIKLLKNRSEVKHVIRLAGGRGGCFLPHSAIAVSGLTRPGCRRQGAGSSYPLAQPLARHGAEPRTPGPATSASPKATPLRPP